MGEKTEMEELAQAAFYVSDVAKGRLGSFKIEEQGWGQGDAPRVMQEIRNCLAFLDMDGWRRDDALAYQAPYSHNIQRAVLKKRFPEGIRWVTVTLATRFGVDCEFTCLDRMPWS